ncbi:MAG: tRNA 2-selenouridine(34) synthase MnmH [Verrucomicrobiales bacterium]|nr:tRNA 2-selenouridine(34) synthase MnmH [Verrucomicrobiales bacterium]
MSRQIKVATVPLSLVDYDEIIDVRSPSEFAEDHMTGALNFPVLDDEQRVEVGTIYKQVSAFDARKLGAAMVSQNIARHIESHFSAKPKEYRVLVYCWRGGQRSGSLSTVLSDIGWDVSQLEGGYRAYRREVIEGIEAFAGGVTLAVLNGYTGAGKTLVLQEIRRQGGQVLDLEGLAKHKGSVFGGDLSAPQPAQKRFESLIFDKIRTMDRSRPVFIEAESAKIGRLNLPNALWQKMKQSTVFEIDSPLGARADYLAGDYVEWLGDAERIVMTLDRLKGFHPPEKIESWKAMVEREEWRDLIGDLLAEHYDKRYNVKGDGNYAVPSDSFALSRHDDESVATCAGTVIAAGSKLLKTA